MKSNDLKREIQDHLDRRAAELERQGLTPAVARRQARLEFGSVDNCSEETRAAAGWPRLESWWRDLRLGARALRRSPGFTCAAVVMLALGIGANAVLFSMVDWLLLRPLPGVSTPAQLVYLEDSRAGGARDNGFSFVNLEDIRRQSSAVFSDVAGVNPLARDGLTVAGVTRPTWTNDVTGNFFSLLGVHAALGRLLTPADAARGPNAEHRIVIAWSLWQSRFGGRHDVIGQQVEVNGRQMEIIGVAPRGFRGAIPVLEPQAYLPVTASADAATLASRGELTDLMLVARLQPGAALASAQPMLAGIAHRLAQAYPKDDPWTGLRAVHLTAEPPGAGGSDTDPLRPIAAIFLALAGLVLLLACVNLASLLLVRADARRRELAVRAALGAGRARLARLLLLENAWVALAGGLAGLALALAGCRALDRIRLDAIHIQLGVGLSWHVLAYTAGLTLFTLLATGIAPAWRGSRAPLNAVLQQGRGAGGGRQRLRSMLVTGELAGTLLLLVLAGLFLRSLSAAQSQALGFEPGHVLNMTLDPHEVGLDQAAALRFYDALLPRVRHLPGVTAASLAWTVPMGTLTGGAGLKLPGQPTAPGQPPPSAGENVVTSGYFATMAIPLLRGRDFTGADTATSPHVAVINQAMARRFWPHQSALGQTFALSDAPNVPVQVVGVATDSRTGTPSEAIGSYIYLALAQYPNPSLGAGSSNLLPQEVLQIRTAGPPMAIAPEVASVIRRLAPTMPVLDVEPMSALLDGLNGLGLFRLGALIAGALGALALLLAAIGVFGVVAYAASQRTHELGVRAALGARRGQLLALVLRQALWILAIALVVGLALAAAAALAINGLLVGVSGHDPVTYLAAAALMAAITLAASLVPALRAMRADPLAALRCE
ncbi:MAG: ADOP family duplicated permease [Terriglobales bacterium]